jgi:hypothetical protein
VQLRFFLLRRSRGETGWGQTVRPAGDDIARTSELDAEEPMAAVTYAKDGNMKPYAQPSELSAVSSPQELPADERARDRVATSMIEQRLAMKGRTEEIDPCYRLLMRSMSMDGCSVWSCRLCT